MSSKMGMIKKPRIVGLVVCITSFIFLSSCASFHVTIPNSVPIQLAHQKDIYVEKNMHAFLWGLMLDPQLFSAECKGQGINDVVIDHNLAHSFVGVISLGLWMPTKVRFRCKAPPIRRGVIPTPQNN